jgi:hypothetical protein
MLVGAFAAVEPPVKSIVLAIFEAYFANIHPVCCDNFLHHGTIFESVDQGTLPKTLLLAVCGVAAKFSNVQDIQQKSEQWNEAAKIQLPQRLASLSSNNVATFQTLALHEIHNGNLILAWNYNGSR